MSFESYSQFLTPEAFAPLEKCMSIARIGGYKCITPVNAVERILLGCLNLTCNACLSVESPEVPEFRCRVLRLAMMTAVAPQPLADGAEPSVLRGVFKALDRAVGRRKPPLKVEANELLISFLEDPSVSKNVAKWSLSIDTIISNLKEGKPVFVCSDDGGGGGSDSISKRRRHGGDDGAGPSTVLRL